MKEMKIVHWLIVVSLLLASVSLLSNNNAPNTVEDIPIKKQAENTNGQSNWQYATPIGAETFDLQVARINDNNEPTITENGWYQMSSTGDTPKDFGVVLDATGNDWLSSEEYKFEFQLWSLAVSSNADTTSFDIIKHGFEQTRTVQEGWSDPPTVSVTIYMEDMGVNRPEGCYWVEFSVSTANADTATPSREQYISGFSPRINFAADGNMPCLYDTNLVDLNVDGNDDSSFDAGCIAGGGTISATGDCTRSLWADEDGDENDDDSFANGQDSVDTDSYYDAGCIAGGGTISSAGNCIPSPWDDADDDTWDDDSYEAGYGDGRESVDLPDCTWHNRTWNGTDCVDIIDPTSDNQEHYDNGYAAACAEFGGDMSGGVCVLPNSCEDCPDNCEDCPDITDGDKDGVIDIFEDTDCLETPENSYVNSTGCVEDITINPTSPSCPCEDDDVNLTGSGDAADLTVVGGAGLLAGIGASSIISQTGRGPRTSGGGNKKPDIDLDDVGDAFDNLDLDMDADLDMDRPKVDTAKPQSVGGSDQYFKSGVERQKAMTGSADPLLDDYTEDESED